MENTMDCSTFRDDMMDVLYGEADAEVDARFEAHRASCASCRDEITSLAGVRQNLQAWGVEPRLETRRRRFALPSWRPLAAAAAVLVAFTTGLLVAKTDVQMRDGALMVRFAPGAGEAELKQELTRYMAEQRAEIEAMKASLTTSPGGATPGDTALLRQVQAMIRESEARQAVLFQTGLTEIGQRAEAQRRYDMARISQGFSYLESKTGADVAKTNELMNQILRVSEDGGK
jgi:hypothetical protein